MIFEYFHLVHLPGIFIFLNPDQRNIYIKYITGLVLNPNELEKIA